MDEHVPSIISQGLRRRGVDVLTAQEAGMRGASDAEHVALALREGRTISTQDVDFLRMHTPGHLRRGIDYAPQHTPAGAIVRGLMLIYEVLHPEEMTGHVEFL